MGAGDAPGSVTDIYGLGATFYTLLTGTVPIDAITRVIANKRIDPLEPAHLVAPDVPWAVAMAIERAMSISSAERFATVEEFWQEFASHAPRQQVPAPDLAALVAPQSLTVPEQELKRISLKPPSALRQHLHPPTSKRHVLLPVLLALLLTAAIGTSLFWMNWQHDSSSTLPRIAHPAAPSTPHSTTTSAASPAPSTPTPGDSVYPSLGASYAGRVVDLMTNETTSMFLTHIQQSQGSISGNFKGLGLVGPFEGTVTPAGHLRFTMKVPASATTLSFEGDIKIGGDIVGTFEVLDQHGQRTGESGAWNVSSNP